MKAHYRPHLWAAVILLILLLLFFHRKLGSQIPVDLRFPPQPVAVRPPTPPVTNEPNYDLIALRYAISDLSLRAQLLRQETSHLRSDTNLLWNTWRGNFGLQGWPFNWGSPLRRFFVPLDPSQAARFQMDLFDLETRARQVDTAAGQLVGNLKAADDQWFRLAAASIAPEAFEAEGAAALRPMTTELRTVLAESATKMNLADIDLTAQQEKFDDVYVRLQRQLQEQRLASLGLFIPWHWRYILSDSPRRSLRYDFETRYAEYMALAHRMVKTTQTPMPRQQKIQTPPQPVAPHRHLLNRPQPK